MAALNASSTAMAHLPCARLVGGQSPAGRRERMTPRDEPPDGDARAPRLAARDPDRYLVPAPGARGLGADGGATPASSERAFVTIASDSRLRSNAARAPSGDRATSLPS